MGYFGSYFGADDGGGGGFEGEVVSIDQSPATRWDPIVATIRLSEGALIIGFESGTNRFLIYDGARAATEQWSGFFEEKSSVVPDGDNFIVTLLPNGGWWTKDFEIRYYGSVELLEE